LFLHHLVLLRAQSVLVGKTLPAIGCLALCILSFDANAWGLATHVFFAQSLTWAIPLAIPALSIAVRRFPAWVLAGACLPDLALFGCRCGTRAFDRNHQWRTARRLLDSAHGDEELAIAVGYCSHLFVDVIAHNHFVPYHERRWPNVKHITHATCEWAMDAHLARHIATWPSQVLRAQAAPLAQYISAAFACPFAEARKTLASLTRWKAPCVRYDYPRLVSGWLAAWIVDRHNASTITSQPPRACSITSMMYWAGGKCCGHQKPPSSRFR
jgi:hypothetical protein